MSFVDGINGVGQPMDGAHQYIADNVSQARELLAQARAALAIAPRQDVDATHDDRAINYAKNAAEHLLDVEQVENPPEAVREALIAAEAILEVTRAFDNRQLDPDAVRHAAHMRFLDIDSNLAWMQRHLETSSH